MVLVLMKLLFLTKNQVNHILSLSGQTKKLIEKKFKKKKIKISLSLSDEKNMQ